MNYETKCVPVCEPAMPSDPMQTLTGAMQKTSAVAEDVLRMAERLHRHLFVCDAPIHHQESELCCFADDVKKTGTLLLATAEELSMIMTKLGV